MIPRNHGSAARLGCTPPRRVISLLAAVSDRDPFTDRIEFAMLPSTVRPSVTNLFQPSLRVWRAQHLAAKVARDKTETTRPKQDEPNRMPTRWRFLFESYSALTPPSAFGDAHRRRENPRKGSVSEVEGVEDAAEAIRSPPHAIRIQVKAEFGPEGAAEPPLPAESTFDEWPERDGGDLVVGRAIKGRVVPVSHHDSQLACQRATSLPP
jgi:hypothetical protein